jgi:DNA-3-methyladenine glycosylase
MEKIDLGQPERVLQRSFYLRSDVVQISRDLLGKVLCTSIKNRISAGVITETEAYAGEIDKASHAYGGRRTARTEIMYRKGGIAYIYLCYGIHSLFNIVTNHENIPHAILIRSIEPIAGIGWMLERIGRTKLDGKPGVGPGRVSQLLGIHYSNSGIDLCNSLLEDSEVKIWIEDHGFKPLLSEIEVTRRIGVDYAGDDARLPYRFLFTRKFSGILSL